ncbi:hypothetical protein BH18THE2_BH18THE2_28490 [soil metagenome]
MISRVLLDKGQRLTWQTPRKLFQQLNEEFHFQLDAATSEDNPMQTSNFYTEKDNGLSKPWLNPTWVNPPYGKDYVILWLEKAIQEQNRGTA